LPLRLDSIDSGAQQPIRHRFSRSHVAEILERPSGLKVIRVIPDVWLKRLERDLHALKFSNG
jgi:hypothetical protein